MAAVPILPRVPGVPGRSFPAGREPDGLMNLLRTGMILLVSSVLIAVAVRAVVWGRLRERRLRAPSIHPVPPEALPLALAPVYRAASRVLAPLGFVPTGARRVEGLDAAQEARPEKVYVHPESHGLALVGPPLPGMGDRPYAVTFVHRVEGGPVVATFDGLSHLLPGTPPGWECHDHDLNDLGRQWALHRQSVEIHRGGARPGALPLDEWNAIETRGLERMLTRWAERKWILPAGGGASTSWRFSSRTAWSLAGRVIAGQRRVLASEARAARARANQQLWRSSLAPVNDAFTRELEEARAAATRRRSATSAIWSPSAWPPPARQCSPPGWAGLSPFCSAVFSRSTRWVTRSGSASSSAPAGTVSVPPSRSGARSST